MSEHTVLSDSPSTDGKGGWERRRSHKGADVKNHVAAVLYVILMVAVIVAVDVLFFKDRPWERLAVNVGIVLVFGAFYFRFLMRP